MRRLTTIRVAGRDGLKGWTGEQRLTGCDVFTGPNGSGKTTRLLTITAGLRGLARTAGPGAEEYIGPQRPKAITTLEWDDGERLGRDLDVVQGTRKAEADARADVLAGRHVARWDLGDFAAFTDKARADLLKGLLGAGGQEWDADHVWAFLDSRMDERTKSLGTDYPLIRLRADHGMPDAGEIGDWLDSAKTWVAEAFTAANAAKTQASKAVEELQRQHREREQAQESGSLAQVKARSAEVEQELQRIAAEIATSEQARKTRTEHQERAQRLATTLGRLETQAKEAAGRVKRAEEALQDAKDRATTDQVLVDLAPLEQAVQARAEALQAADSALHGARDAYAGAKAEIAQLETLAGAAGVCVHCGAEDPLGLTVRLETAKALLPRLELRGKLIRDRHAAARKAMDEAQADLAQAQAASATQAAQQQRAAESVVRCTETLTAAQGEQDRLRTAITEAETDLQVLKEEAPWTGSVDLAGLKARQSALQAERVSLTAQSEALARDQGGEVAVQQAIASRDAAETRLAEIKALQKALTELQAEVARGAYGPITDHANRLLSDAAVPLRVYIESEGDFGGVKLDRGDLRVHFASLSDGERALVGASLAYAFAVAAKSPCPMVILDRLEAIDSDRLQGFLGACDAAVKDVRLSNFVGALRVDAISQVPEIAGVKVHWLGGAE